MKKILLSLIGFIYQRVVKPVFFLQPPDKIHERITAAGERMGKSGIIKTIISPVFQTHSPMLEQTIHGINFLNPVGLSAGFDYDST